MRVIKKNLVMNCLERLAETDCDEGYELMLQGNDSVCVAKECGTFSRAWFSGAAEDVVRECRFGDLSTWIHSVRWCKVRRGRRFCSCGVSCSGFTTKLRRPCVYTRTVEFEHQPQLTLDFAQKDSEYKTNEVSEKYTASHR